MKHALYKLEKIKITFKHHRSIDIKLYWPMINYPNFYSVTHLAQCIWDYGSTINYDITHSKAVYKYFFKVFDNRTNKKEYNTQIW